ncbi:MAG: glutamate-1-semialdehyde 2,1-aminomutase [Steroidobacteraceae bacterium]
MTGTSDTEPVAAPELRQRFDESHRLAERAQALIPGGSHTYAKGPDQFPDHMPGIMERGLGCHAWDVDGNEFIEYGMGLRAVTLGHAFAPILEAAQRALPMGTNFTRPARIEIECAEKFLSIIQWAEMVKFCKDGSDALDGGVRLARAFTGRDRIAICGDHPFFSTSDWFIGSTGMPGGIPQATRELTVKFSYNDIDSLRGLFAQYPAQIACVVMEPARTEEPRPNYLQEVKALCHDNGAILLFDEMITGFRWHLAGAQAVYNVTPDLSTFGKALANGFSVSALAGRRDIMELGGSRHKRERVFLLSTTHGAESHELAAAIATMDFYQRHSVVDRLYTGGARLRTGIEQRSRSLGLQQHFGVVSRDVNLLYMTRDQGGAPSAQMRTLFLQEIMSRGVIAPSFVVSYSHSDADIDRTLDVVYAALKVYRRALENGVDDVLRSRPVLPVFRRFA